METVLSITPENVVTITLMAFAGFLLFSIAAAAFRGQLHFGNAEGN